MKLLKDVSTEGTKVFTDLNEADLTVKSLDVTEDIIVKQNAIIDGSLIVNNDDITTFAVLPSGVEVKGDFLVDNQKTRTNKLYTFDLTGYSNTLWYPISFRTYKGGYTGAQNNDGRIHNFEISSISGSASIPYNNNTLKGFARGSGYSDTKSLANITLERYSEIENVFYGIYRGTQTYADIVIYVRGGNYYFIYSDSNFVEGHTTNFEDADAIFQAGVATPTGTNITPVMSLHSRPSGVHSNRGGSSNKSIISAYANNASLSLGTSGVIPIDTALTNIGNRLSLSSGKINILFEGYYRISANLWVNDTTRCWFRVDVKNSAGVLVSRPGSVISPETMSTGSPYFSGSVSPVTLYMSVGDYVEINYINAVTGALLNAGSSYANSTSLTVEAVE